jgi:flotillin
MEILGMSPDTLIITVIVILAFVAIFGGSFYASRYQKAGPNEVLLVSGRKYSYTDHDGSRKQRGFKIVRGGTFVWPVIEKFDRLSLELLTLDIITPEFYTKRGVPVKVDGVAQIKVKSDDISVATAAEQFLSKSVGDIMGIAKLMMAGHLRGILGTMTVEDLLAGHETFAQQVANVTAADISNMGMTVVSFTIRDISDSRGYLEALGKPQIAIVKRDAAIGEAEAGRDSTIRSAQANQEAQMGKLAADTKIAEANRDYQLKMAEYNMATSQAKAEADLAYDLQKFKTEQIVKKEEVGVQLVEKQAQIAVQEQEISRKEKELAATVTKPAEADRLRVQTIADGEQYRLKATAAGQAEATRVTGLAQADIVRAQGEAQAAASKAQGLAQAEVIKATGDATAQAMNEKAAAWAKYNEAAMIEVLADKLPEIAKVVFGPLAKTDKITIVSQDGTLGASKFSGDMANIASSMPAILKALTGADISQLLTKVPGLGEVKPLTAATPTAQPEQTA